MVKNEDNAEVAPEPSVEATPKVEVLDREAELARREQYDKDEVAAARRASHVAALKTELDYLNRTPTPSAERVAAVQSQLDEYGNEPTARNLETRG